MISGRKIAGLLRRRVVLIALACVVLVLVAAVMLPAEDESAELSGQATFVVERGPLTIAVSEPGTIQAREQVVLKSEVEGRTTIIYLVEEGAHVEQGDLLVELDSSGLQDKLLEQQIDVQNAEADFIRARENLAVTDSQARSDIASAELELQFAGEDLIKYTEGEYPKLLKEAQAKITLASEELERAEEKLIWSERLHQNKYISETELQSDRLARNRQKLNHELAVAELELLEKYTHKRQLAQLRSDVEQADMALERVKRRASADVVQAEADLLARETQFQREKQQLAKVEDQVRKCRIVAPRSGMVIYATTGKGNHRGNAEPLDEGQEVREREELIHLPTAGSMMAEVKVHETALQKVAVGQPVRLTVDALPGRVYTGRVARIAPLPDAQSVWMNPDLKVYSTEIILDSDAIGLRTGMTCMAQIVIDHFPDTVYVPVHTIVRVDSTPTVFVAKGNRIEARPITMGSDNNRMAQVLRGLEPGERVLQTPPLSAGQVAGGLPRMDSKAEDAEAQALLRRSKEEANALASAAVEDAAAAAAKRRVQPVGGGDAR